MRTVSRIICSVWNSSPPCYPTQCLKLGGEACWNLILSCCDRRPLLPSSWTAKPLTGTFSVFSPVSCYTFFLSVSTQCWGKVRWWPATTAGSRDEEATCGSSPLPPSLSTTKRPMNATSFGSTTSWGQCSHSVRSRTADMNQVYICRRHTVHRDALKG